MKRGKRHYFLDLFKIKSTLNSDFYKYGCQYDVSNRHFGGGGGKGVLYQIIGSWVLHVIKKIGPNHIKGFVKMRGQKDLRSMKKVGEFG